MFLSTVRTLLRCRSEDPHAPTETPPTPSQQPMKSLQFAEEECVLLLAATRRHRQLTTLRRSPDCDSKSRNFCSNNANRLNLSLSLRHSRSRSRSHSQWPQHPNKLVRMGDGL